MMHAVLQYSYGDDYLESRELYRSAHLALAWAAVERGALVLGGAVGTGPYEGLIVFKGENALELASDFASADPYVTSGLVTSWTVRPWNTVVGIDASAPVRP